MSDTQGISRNRDDYPPKIRLLARAIADVFHDGNEDEVWEDFFRIAEKNAAHFDSRTYQPASARLHMRATSASNQSPETKA